MNLDDKIDELKQFLKHTQKVNWFTNAVFEWKGNEVKIDSYEWCIERSSWYDGKLSCLEELKKEGPLCLSNQRVREAIKDMTFCSELGLIPELFDCIERGQSIISMCAGCRGQRLLLERLGLEE